LPVRSRGLYRIKSGNDCSISVSSLQPPALLMHPVGREGHVQPPWKWDCNSLAH
jgi:hypothetical protein